MKKSLFLSVLLHLVLITIFLSLPFAVDLSKKSKAIKVTFGPPDATSQKIPSEEKEIKPNTKPAPIPPEPEKPTQVPAKPKSEVSNLPVETPTAPMQQSANTQPEASPEVYGSMGLDSYYYNKPMEAYSPLPSTKSPAKKPQQQYAIKSSMQSSPNIPMQKSSMILTETVPTMTVSIIKNISRETAPLNTAPVTAQLLNSATNSVESNGEKNFIAQQAYIQDIQQTILQSKTYPEETEVGTVKIKFRIAKDGTLLKVEIIESSGSKTLDTAGAVLLKKIVKLQPLPDSLKKEFMDIILNLNYQ